MRPELERPGPEASWLILSNTRSRCVVATATDTALDLHDNVPNNIPMQFWQFARQNAESLDAL
jgi:hypothetical protein